MFHCSLFYSSYIADLPFHMVLFILFISIVLSCILFRCRCLFLVFSFTPVVFSYISSFVPASNFSVIFHTVLFHIRKIHQHGTFFLWKFRVNCSLQVKNAYTDKKHIPCKALYLTGDKCSNNSFNTTACTANLSKRQLTQQFFQSDS